MTIKIAEPRIPKGITTEEWENFSPADRIVLATHELQNIILRKAFKSNNVAEGLVRSIYDAVGATQWRPIETCPKDEVYYLMTGGKYPCLATWDDQDEEWFTFNGDYERVNKKPYRPTHWMPCPPPAPIGDK